MTERFLLASRGLGHSIMRTENPRVGGSIPPLGTIRQDRSELPAVPRAGFDVRSGGLVRTGLSALLPQRCTSPESSWHGSFLPNALACSALFGPADCCMCGHWTLRRGEHVATDHRKWIGAGAERRLLKGRRLQRGSDMREPGLRLATAIPIGTRSARANTSAGNIGSTPRGVLTASASGLVPAARHRIRIPYRQHV